MQIWFIHIFKSRFIARQQGKKKKLCDFLNDIVVGCERFSKKKNLDSLYSVKILLNFHISFFLNEFEIKTWKKCMVFYSIGVREEEEFVRIGSISLLLFLFAIDHKPVLIYSFWIIFITNFISFYWKLFVFQFSSAMKKVK